MSGYKSLKRDPAEPRRAKRIKVKVSTWISGSPTKQLQTTKQLAVGDFFETEWKFENLAGKSVSQ